MKVTCAMLASYAEINMDGKLSMIGGDIDNLAVVKFPSSPTFPVFFVLKLLFDAEECNRAYKIRVTWKGPGGFSEEVERTESILPPPTMQAFGTKLGIIIVFHAMTFTESGVHPIKVYLDGNEIVDLPIRISQTDQSGKASN